VNVIRTGTGLVLLVVITAGCTRPAAPESASAAPPVAAPVLERANRSPFFSKVTPARLDDIAMRSAPKDPRWKWDSVRSEMSFSPRPGDIEFIEAGRYIVADPSQIEGFMRAFEDELKEEVQKSGAKIPERAAGDPINSEAFSFSYTDDTTRGRVRSTITREREGVYNLVVRVEEIVAAKAP
jgi:hypothetical protein